MKLAKAKLQRGDQTARLAPLEELGGRYVKFGTDILVYADEAEYDGVAARAEQDGFFLDEFGSVDNREDMYVVGQMGAVFQLLHPDVQILFDKGRYLLVKMAPEQAATLSAGEDPHYSPDFSIERLQDNQTIFDVRAQGADRVARVPWVQELVDAVSDSGFESNLEHLVNSFPTRFSPSGHFDEAVAWARSQLDAMGYATTVEPFTFGANETSQNLIADKPGRETGTRQLVIVCAHMDSINIQGGQEGPAPGADDNGSGFMGLLEMARVLKDHAAVHDLRFIGFGAEERGLFGSREYVDRLPPADRQRVKCVVNMDMIGTVNGTPSPTVLLEGAPVSRSVINDLASAAATYTSLTVQTSEQPFASDHVCFIRANVPAVLTIEGTDSANHHVHTMNDTLVYIDYNLAAEILRMNVATVATALERKGDVGVTEDVTPLGGSISETEPKARGPQLSGLYQYNGGVPARRAMHGGTYSVASRYATVEDPPIYPLPGPIYLPDPPDPASQNLPVGQRAADAFTLRIDVDGPKPLNVVSGTVAGNPSGAAGGSQPQHFIGRVTSDTLSAGTRNLVVEDFNFRWPGSDGNGTAIDRLEIKLAASLSTTQTAEATFVASGSDARLGPYIVQQDSSYFHDVEVEIDREDGALEVEPYDTLTHPDRPADLPGEELTLQEAYARAGIRITLSPNSDVVASTEGGSDQRWTYQELHDSMEDHWSAFSNRPQWRMWIFLAELAYDAGLGGVMFDGDIDEPGGVDRQGTAIFTKNAFFHTADGSYTKANPPASEAAKRELFFNLCHEVGHAFNLAHSFGKTAGSLWPAPSWMPVATNPTALSWMNYPDEASKKAVSGPTFSAKWFYDRFRFRFVDEENLFLRHAPAGFVQMGSEAWLHSHARVARSEVDPRLEFQITSNKQGAGAPGEPIFVELGEPVVVRLRLYNRSDEAVPVHLNLHPRDGGFVELAVTSQRGRKPFEPHVTTRSEVKQHILQPKQAISEVVDLTVGLLGFPFKEPGPYRIEASYSNTGGGTAAAVAQLYVRPPANYDDVRAIGELFNARMGRALYVGGTRTMEDINEKIDWIIGHLGAEHPVQYHLAAARGLPFANPFKSLKADVARVTVLDRDPEVSEGALRRVVDNPNQAFETIGYESYARVADAYTSAAREIGKGDEASRVARETTDLFESAENVPTEVKEAAARRAEELA